MSFNFHANLIFIDVFAGNSHWPHSQRTQSSPHAPAYLLNYLLTPWSRVLIEKLVKTFPAFYGTRRFITAFTSARHMSLSWARSIQSIRPHPTAWRSMFQHISLKTHCPIILFPVVFPTKYFLHFYYFPCVLHTHPSLFIYLTLFPVSRMTQLLVVGYLMIWYIC